MNLNVFKMNPQPNKARSRKGFAIGCSAVFVLAFLCFALVLQQEKPAKVIAKRAAAIQHVSNWLQPDVRTQLIVEATALIEEQTKNGEFPISAAGHSCFDRNKYPTLFGHGMADTSGIIFLPATHVFSWKEGDSKCVSIDFEACVSWLHPSKIYVSIQPDGHLPDVCRYILRFTDNGKQQIGISVLER